MGLLGSVSCHSATPGSGRSGSRCRARRSRSPRCSASSSSPSSATRASSWRWRSRRATAPLTVLVGGHRSRRCSSMPDRSSSGRVAVALPRDLISDRRRASRSSWSRPGRSAATSWARSDEGRAPRTGRWALLTIGTAFFLAELGDKTMLATITLATPTSRSRPGSDRRRGWSPPTPSRSASARSSARGSRSRRSRCLPRSRSSCSAPAHRLRPRQAAWRAPLRLYDDHPQRGRGPVRAAGDVDRRSETRMEVRQRIRRSDGTWAGRATDAVAKDATDGHGHWHIQRVSGMDLFMSHGGGADRPQIGFCFFDMGRYNPGLLCRHRGRSTSSRTAARPRRCGSRWASAWAGATPPGGARLPVDRRDRRPGGQVPRADVGRSAGALPRDARGQQLLVGTGSHPGDRLAGHRPRAGPRLRRPGDPDPYATPTLMPSTTPMSMPSGACRVAWLHDPPIVRLCVSCGAVGVAAPSGEGRSLRTCAACGSLFPQPGALPHLRRGRAGCRGQRGGPQPVTDHRVHGHDRCAQAGRDAALPPAGPAPPTASPRPTPAFVAADPAGLARHPHLVRNTGTVVDELRITVEGPVASWARSRRRCCA